MWFEANLTTTTPAERIALKKELYAIPSRQVIAITSIFFSVCLLLVAGNATWDLMLQLMAAAGSLAFVSWVAYHRVESQYPLVMSGWLVSQFALLTLVIILLRQPELVLFYLMLVLISTSALGRLAGFASGLLAVFFIYWLPRAGLIPEILPLTLGIALVVGVFAALPGWLVSSSLVSMALWTTTVSEQARQTLDATRDQRLELKQVQEDLIKANSELARLSDRMKYLHQEAEEARQAKTQFVANVSHELRTPLNMIIGFAEMISQAPQIYGNRLPAALISDITAIERNAQHLSRLINDVLDLSQVEAGRMALSKEWTDIHGVIEAAVSLVRGLFASKGLNLEVDLPADLPRLFCDGTRIQQVIVNLLSNAGRFTETGGVTVRCQATGEELVISMSDTGPGISPDDQKRLFQPFQQVDGSSRRKYGGSGLGLSISKQFIEMHGGEIELGSTVGVGTTFVIHLPVDSPAPEGQPGRSPAARWFNPTDPFGLRLRTRPFKAPRPVVKPQFVIVERERTLQKLFRRYVTGADIVICPDVPSAVTEVKRSASQMIIVNAPPHEAWSEGLSDLPFGTPAIACWVPGEEEAAKQLGVVRYLIKPVGHQALLAAVEELGPEIQNILVIDDEADELHLFVRMLASSPRQYRILQATNGRRALTMLRSRHPDLVVTDLAMPGISGLQVLQEKGQDPAIRDIPVIVVTGQDPIGGFIGNTLSVVRGSQLTAQELLACIQAIAGIFAPLQSEQSVKEEPAEGLFEP